MKEDNVNNWLTKVLIIQYITHRKIELESICVIIKKAGDSHHKRNIKKKLESKL